MPMELPTTATSSSWTCPSCKYDRVEFIDYFRLWIEDGRHAIFSPYSHFCSFFIQVTPSTDAGEFGAPPATRYACMVFLVFIQDD
jgi:hypothetical protein